MKKIIRTGGALALAATFAVASGAQAMAAPPVRIGIVWDGYDRTGDAHVIWADQPCSDDDGINYRYQVPRPRS